MFHRFSNGSPITQIVLVLSLIGFACSPLSTDGVPENGTTGVQPDASVDDALFEPVGLPNRPANSIPGELTLFASTLVQGPAGLELYAAVRNDGPTPLCGAGILLEFYDNSDQLLGTASGGVESGRLYQFVDDTVTIYCVGTGQTAMAWSTNLPPELVVDDLAYVTHRFPAFVVDVTPLPSLIVSEVEPYATDTGVAFRGTVLNEGDTPITEANVSVFPVNSAGRPLGKASSTATAEIPAQGTWVFETSAVTDRGTATFAVAAGVRRTDL